MVGRTISRRDFIRVSSATGVGMIFVGRVNGRAFAIPLAAAAIPGGTLDPAAVPKFVTPLLIPPVMPRAGTVDEPDGREADYYEISMRQFTQQVLPEGLPATTVWGYGPVAAEDEHALLLHNAPSLTIETTFDRPVHIKWINELVDDDGNFLPHLLPVDATLHWANPPGGTRGRDSEPRSPSTPPPYIGPVPIVTHVHGAADVGDESDGYAEAWYVPAAGNIPDGYTTEGTWYEFFATKAAAKFGAAWGAGFATFHYPNRGRAATNWYHDHALGITRLNVYTGPAGFYLLRGGPDGEDAVVDSRTGEPASLPGPAPRPGDPFPSETRYLEIPIAIQDRSFNADGSLFYPDSRSFFDGIEGPYLPDSDVPPIWNPEFFGNTIIVNGATWPHLTVEQRRYRLRMLNGCQSRFVILDFGSIPGVDVWSIGSDGGFLAAPADLTADNGNRLLMAPAERADLIVDFTSVPPGSHVLGNLGPDEPFGGGEPGVDFAPADPETTGRILEFRVVPATEADHSTPARFLRLPPIAPIPDVALTRPLAVIELMSEFFDDAPAEAELGTIDGDPNAGPATWDARSWHEPVTENPAVGTSEMWELYNTTGDAHPIHIHEVTVEVVDRQDIEVDEDNTTVRVVPGSVARPPEIWEAGRKDTVVSYPGQVLRVRALFDTAGQYVWHCHILEHEDNEMMRPYRIGPLQEGQPPDGGMDSDS